MPRGLRSFFVIAGAAAAFAVAVPAALAGGARGRDGNANGRAFTAR